MILIITIIGLFVIALLTFAFDNKSSSDKDFKDFKDEPKSLKEKTFKKIEKKIGHEEE